MTYPHPAHRSEPPPAADPPGVELTADLALDPGVRRMLAALVLLQIGAPVDVAELAALADGTSGHPEAVLARLDGVAARFAGETP